MKRTNRTHRHQLESLEPRRLLTTYAVDLGNLGYGPTAPSDINASGQIVGTATRPDGNSRAFLWQNGVMIDLGTLGGSYSRALGVNDAGQVVGQSAASTAQFARAFLLTPEDTDGNGKPDRWFRDSNSDGKNDLMRDLGTIGGNYVEATANDVNNLGQVVGNVSTDWLHGSVSHAFRWQNGVMTDMGTFGGSRSGADAINDAGQITGWTSSGRFLWKGGVVTLGVGGVDINASGQLVDSLGGFGQMWTPTVPNGSSGTFATLGQLPPNPSYDGVETSAQSINAAGQVVGTQADVLAGGEIYGTSYFYRAVKWTGGVPQELPLETAAAINNAGDIVGTRGAGAFLLTDENFAIPLLTISGATVTEGNAGSTNAVFTVSLSKASTQTITVQYATADGTATAGSDYLATAGTLTFAPGQTSRTISVTVLGDRSADYDPNTFSEAFTVALTNPTNALVAGDAASGVIRDDEPRISGDGTTVLEGNSGIKAALVTVSLSSSYDQPVTVGYETVGQGATAGSDFVETSGTLTFAPGQTSKQIAVSILGDHLAEVEGEYVYVFFSNPSGNGSVVRQGHVGIQDDEPRVTITPYVELDEPATGMINALLTVSLSAAYDQDVVVDYSTYDGDPGYAAYAPYDYVATVASVRIPAGQTSRTITVPIVGDGVVEPAEYFYVGLTGVSGNAFIPDYDGGGSLASVGIRDYDGTVKNWIGPASGGNWSTAANWSPSGVPTASHAVYISGKSVNLTTSATFAGLTLTGGATLTVASNGNRVLRTSALVVSSNSTLNLNDNDLIVDYSSVSPVGIWTGGDYNGVTGLVKSGRIVSSTASGTITTLGVAEARDVLGITGNQTALFSGQTVDATSVLVKFTWGGDANLDGKIHIDDYGQIDFNAGSSGSVFGWFNGDFNLDGKINIDDYGIIDFNIAAQGPPL
ncbi:MAG: Calx-beta domain-containing protein [Tepidisphaeraceae bacterium]